MSQRRFVSNDLEVLCGWDRPLGEFFLSVFNEEAELEDDNAYVVYSSLDGQSFGTDVNHVLFHLNRLGLPYPSSLRDDLLRDMDLNAGNLLVTYDAVS